MAPAKFDRIVCVSSEDPACPAENLLKNAYSDKKWKSKEPGEKQISVVIQLEKAEKISAIDVGNHGSAFIEIFVCKSSNPDDFKVLVVASSLMTLQESKLGNNLSGVRFFKEDSLVKDVATDKWDRVKIICSQPYNKHIQYGLSFIVIHCNSTPTADIPSPVLGKFQLKTKDESNGLTVGSLFMKRKENGHNEVKGAAAIRAASTSGVIQRKVITAPPQVTSRTSELNPSPKVSLDLNVTKDESGDLRKKTPKTSSKNKPRGILNGDSNSLSTASKRVAEDTKENARKKVPLKPRIERPFNKLFDGVVFTISGFQNPYRSEIRSKALAMGAKYRPDWDNTCTHLLCAFPNTPKFNQVLGHGKIITKEWIETCYNRRIYIPWRRYALHPPDKAAPESDEEVFEKVERPPSPVDNRRRVSPGRSSGEDTEEEIERVLQIQAKNKDPDDSEVNNVCSSNGSYSPLNNDTPLQKKSTVKKQKESPILKIKTKRSNEEKIINNVDTLDPSTEIYKDAGVSQKKDKSSIVPNKSPKKKNKVKEKNLLILEDKTSCANKFLTIQDALLPEDTYDLDTAEEDDTSESKKLKLPFLPVIFEGIKFFVADDLDKNLQKQVWRYLVSHKGSVVEKDDILSEEVQIVITESKEEFRKVKENYPSAIGLRPEWVWKAHDEGRIPPTSAFEINC